tara:strand:+ start:51767 stop:52327 length:561 start_codon:yes stop_codon:yes gene_type:complete
MENNINDLCKTFLMGGTGYVGCSSMITTPREVFTYLQIPAIRRGLSAENLLHEGTPRDSSLGGATNNKGSNISYESIPHNNRIIVCKLRYCFQTIPKEQMPKGRIPGRLEVLSSQDIQGRLLLKEMGTKDPLFTYDDRLHWDPRLDTHMSEWLDGGKGPLSIADYKKIANKAIELYFDFDKIIKSQ